MAKVGAQRAAELTGKSKSTIQRAMKSGKLSFEKLDNKRRVIDVSELERVFGLEKTEPKQSNVEAELQKAKDILEMERLKMRIRTLETQVHTLETQIDDLKGQRDNWQKQAQQVLLTSQHAQKQADDLQKKVDESEERARAEKIARQKRIQQNMMRMKQRSQNQNQQQSGSLWDKITGRKRVS